MSRILLVDDNAALREQYAYDLNRLGGHEVRTAADGIEALEVLAAEPFDCVVLDLEMPRLDGFGVLQGMAKQGVDTPVVVYTGTGDYARCVRAVRLGAWGFIDKGEPTERVAQEIENALAHGRLAREIADLKRRHGEDSALVGDGPAMTALCERIDKLAPIPSPVLILGESGTGKELVARELHRLGSRPKGPFVAINCAALPETLAESELFGHERGAFTGADRLRRGAFESAAGGTLLLDEIGELPASLQAKLLRVLETETFTRVGGEKSLKADARIVAATNRDPDAEVAAGRFREDLLFRLNVHTLTAPPLRDRPEDVPALVRHFLRAICERFRIDTVTIDPEALEILAARDWERNNVRELRNTVERLVMDSENGRIDAAVIARGAGRDADDAPPREGTLQDLREDAERRIVRAALRRNNGHLTKTARQLGLADHASLSKVIKRLGIEK